MPRFLLAVLLVCALSTSPDAVRAAPPTAPASPGHPAHKEAGKPTPAPAASGSARGAEAGPATGTTWRDRLPSLPSMPKMPAMPSLSVPWGPAKDVASRGVDVVQGIVGSATAVVSGWMGDVTGLIGSLTADPFYLQKWEYRVVILGNPNEAERSLNTLGRDGWELVQILPAADRRLDPGPVSGGVNDGWAAVLKRQPAGSQKAAFLFLRILPLLFGLEHPGK